MKTLELIRIILHGSQSFFSVDVEFLNKFYKELRYFYINFKPTPDLRHNMLSFLERNISVVLLLV